ncbi:putative arsenical pump-driving ATPase 1 [Bryobacterales bacterium F-183]|nr:putative arsenical pump-driving ATPase 1 [Bryobacterales bacterium F-183]
MSVDPAHSLGDSFDLSSQGDAALFHGSTGEPRAIRDKLWIQEVNIQREIKRHWKEISSYVTSALRTTGLNDVEAEEMAIFPGMEELSAMMYVNQYLREKTYDVVVLDCAPTAESLRFISLPTTLDWYMKHVFTLQRRVMKAVRPLLNTLGPIEAPPDSYFGNIQSLFQKIEGIDTVLEDPNVTSVRLVTNAERMVLRETQRAFVYFSLHGLCVDGIIVNRVLPDEVTDSFFDGRRAAQQQILGEIESYFAPVPVSKAPLFQNEVLGEAGLTRLAEQLYRDGADPAKITRTDKAYEFAAGSNGAFEVRVRMPFVQKGEIGLFKKNDELVVEIGTIRRHIGLPTTMSAMTPSKARMERDMLVVELRNTA